MANILIIYSTTDGHTRKICRRLEQVIARQHQVNVVPIEDVKDSELETFDMIVLGASIRYGKHGKPVYEFIKRNQALLDSMPNAFFSVNVVARKPEKNQPDTNPYLKKFLRQISWQPRLLAVFAGKIDYQMYSIWDRSIIRLIMWITRGPTDPATNVEFTDWQQVEDFAHIIGRMT